MVTLPIQRFSRALASGPEPTDPAIAELSRATTFYVSKKEGDELVRHLYVAYCGHSWDTRVL